MNMYVGNLNYRVKEGDLEQAMSAYGVVTSVKVIKDRETGKSKGFAFVEMEDDQDAAKAINELNGSVDVWELKDPYGKIECVQTLDMMPADFTDTRWAADIHITPDGRHLYTCDRTSSLITIFSVSEDGSVLSLEGFQPTETQPRGFNVDHSGKYLIAAGQKSHHVAVYEIAGEQGLLQEKGRYAVGQGPMWVVVNAH